MKERPILFSAPMVRALLNGSKTQTRRVVKLRNGQYLPPSESADRPGWQQLLRNCPYGIPGDRLWVKETWGLELLWGAAGEGSISRGYEIRYRAGGKHGFTYEGPDSETDPFLRYYDTQKGNWRPSIYMPYWASRILLDITSVRVERLQDISEADALAEGVMGCKPELVSNDCWYCPEELYSMLWTKIHGHGSWNTNPWVWVLAFTLKENSNG
ncbi:hypothetical protein [Aquitalea sp. ASV11]|uniref:hypothetical protein n=1 Tax=Aquitalea sp. ASV11 TaxID=2795103 RepID=UPI0018EB8568|nr:hypothetical protein [Aquitalea sp. ASV11]